jgi:hypothetical protein
MTFTFENDSDIIIYALEKVITHARRAQQIFLAQCVWWLATIIGLYQGLIKYIHNLHQVPQITIARSVSATPRDFTEDRRDCFETIHPDRIPQITIARLVSAIHRDLTEDSRIDQILDSAEQCIEKSERARNTWQQNRVNTLPSSKTQIKKARKIRRLQEVGKKQEAERNQRLQEIRARLISNLSKK